MPRCSPLRRRPCLSPAACRHPNHPYLDAHAQHSVFVQTIGERRGGSRSEERVLHVDLATGALRILAKEAVKATLRLGAVTQMMYDEAEPRSIVVSCSDDRRYLIDFQNAEDNLAFRWVGIRHGGGCPGARVLGGVPDRLAGAPAHSVQCTWHCHGWGHPRRL